MTLERWRGRGAALQRRVDAVTPGRLLRVLVDEIAADDVTGMAAEMAYRFLFALFPALLLLTTALGFLGDTLGLDDLFERLLRQVGPLLPAVVYGMLDSYVSGLLETRSTAFLTAGLLGAIWGTAGGVGTLMKGLDRAYDVSQPRPFWLQQAIALAAAVVFPPFAVALFLLTVAGRSLAHWLSSGLGLEKQAGALMALAQWPVLALVLVAGLSLTYHFLPNTRHRYWWSLPGSALAAAGWLLLTQLFSLYLANFGRFDATYGSFGAIIAFLLWLYLVGMVVLLGAEVNAVLEPSQRQRWRHAREIPPTGMTPTDKDSVQG